MARKSRRLGGENRRIDGNTGSDGGDVEATGNAVGGVDGEEFGPVGQGPETASGAAAGTNGPESDTSSASGDAPELAAGPIPARRRGRKPGGKNRPKSAPGKPERDASERQAPRQSTRKGVLDVADTALKLGKFHGFLAFILQTPEMALTQSEAEALATALADVSRHYDLPQIADKYACLGALGFTAFMIYQPRVAAIVARAKQRKGQKAHEQSGNPGGLVGGEAANSV